MQTKDLYDRYFDETKRKCGYPSNAEWMEDLYFALDAILCMTIEWKADLGISLEMMRVRGLSVTFEEIQQYFYPKETYSMDSATLFMEELLLLIQEHMKSRVAATDEQIALALLTLWSQEHLSEWQIFCLVLGCACGTDRKYERIFTYLQDSSQAVYATNGLVWMLYQFIGKATINEYTELLVGSAFLEQYFVKGQEQWEMLSFLGKPITAKPRIAAYLYGETQIPPHMAEGCILFSAVESPAEVLLYQREQQQLRRLVQEGNQRDGMCIILQGEVGSGRKLMIQNMAFSQRKKVLFVEAEILENEDTRERLLADIHLELILQDAYLCLCNCNLQEGLLSKAVRFFMKVCQGRNIPFFLTSQKPIAKIISTYGNKMSYDNPFMKYCVMELALGLPNAQEKIFLWKYFLANYECEEDIDAVALGYKYLLNAGEVQNILGSAALYAKSVGRKKLRENDILLAMKQHNSNTLGLFAERIEAVFTWDDLVVEQEVHKQLQYICNRLRYGNVVDNEWGFKEKMPYGRGTCALFYGTSGTGKTMAVQVLANTLGLELYRIDLSRMLSKYIGETQKHISELFERAKNINALLFFDEADAFFSKRTEVGSSNDRNANSEVAHLLQKLEAYEGISVLATNLMDNIDDAFKRRIKYMIRFQLPDVSTRQLLWKKTLPIQAPVERDLALSYFAEHFELSGSEIKETMIHAAYMAAEEHSAIGNRHVIEALRICFAKYGMLLTKDDFGYLL